MTNITHTEEGEGQVNINGIILKIAHYKPRIILCNLNDSILVFRFFLKSR